MFLRNYRETRIGRVGVPFAAGLLACGLAWAGFTSVERYRKEKRDAQAGVWTDRATGLMWTKHDNGYDVSWRQAVDYCRGLALEGVRWQLPRHERILTLWQNKRLKEGIAL